MTSPSFVARFATLCLRISLLKSKRKLEGDARFIMDANHATEKFTVLTPAEAETLAAIAERIFPKTNTPGAVEIGAVNYIDIALAGDYAPLVPAYRQGIRAVHRYARSKLRRALFRSLTTNCRTPCWSPSKPGRSAGFKNAAEFFETVRYHVIGRNFLRAAVRRQQGYDGLALVDLPWPTIRLRGRLCEQARRSGAGCCGLQQERRRKNQ